MHTQSAKIMLASSSNCMAVWANTYLLTRIPAWFHSTKYVCKDFLKRQVKDLIRLLLYVYFLRTRGRFGKIWVLLHKTLLQHKVSEIYRTLFWFFWDFHIKVKLIFFLLTLEKFHSRYMLYFRMTFQLFMFMILQL